ncbi:MAG: ABC transporter ATP-binding protein [Chloroflexi bacterium]|nr:ABC transporter ATP-binding protein [Chloroflexota bacterium]
MAYHRPASGASPNATPRIGGAAGGLIVDSLEVTTSGRDPRRILRGVSLSLQPGEVRALVGESGSGKSVTALAIMGILPRGLRLTGGRVELGGSTLTGLSESGYERVRGTRIAMVFQDPMASLNPVMAIGDQIVEPIRAHLRLDRHATQARVIGLLDQVGLPSDPQTIRKFPHELSGGMRQRVMIALALACDPEMLLADEPTTALDVTVQAKILELLRSIVAERRLSVLFVTHALAVAAQLAHSTSVMYAGLVVESGPTDEVLHDPQHPYTRGLLDAAPSLTVRTRPIPTMPGSVEGIWQIADGCRFRPRCPIRMDVCATDEPPLGADGASHAAACWVTNHAMTVPQP